MSSSSSSSVVVVVVVRPSLQQRCNQKTLSTFRPTPVRPSVQTRHDTTRHDTTTLVLGGWVVGWVVGVGGSVVQSVGLLDCRIVGLSDCWDVGLFVGCVVGCCTAGCGRLVSIQILVCLFACLFACLYACWMVGQLTGCFVCSLDIGQIRSTISYRGCFAGKAGSTMYFSSVFRML